MPWLKKFFLKKKSISILAVILLLIFLHFTNILLPAEKFIITFFLPAQKILSRAASRINKVGILKKFNFDLLKENIRLEDENLKLLKENSELNEKLQRFESLQMQISYLAEKKFDYVLSDIIGKDIYFESSIIICNKGSRDGIMVGLPVIVRDGVLIGKIIEVSDTTSKAILLTDSWSQTAAALKSNEKTIGIVVGDHGLGMKMILVPQEENIQINDIVVTSGIEDHIPKGLLIGRIEGVEKDQNIFFQNAYVKPLLSYSILETV